MHRGGRYRLCALCAALLLFSAGGAARGQPAADPRSPSGEAAAEESGQSARDELLRAIALYQQSDFDQARALLLRVLARVGQDRSRTAEEAHAYMACVHVAFGDTEAAVAAFEQALAINPELRLPLRAPKIEAAFEQARTRYRARVRAMDHDPPTLQHLPPKQGRYGKSLAMEVRVADLSAVKRVVLNYRLAGNRGFSSVNMEPSAGDGRFVATVPGLAVARPGVEYYIEAWDELGNGPGLKGSALAPISVQVQGGPLPHRKREDRPRWYRQWWFWTALVGAAAVAGGVAAAIYVTREESARIDLSVSELNK